MSLEDQAADLLKRVRGEGFEAGYRRGWTDGSRAWTEMSHWSVGRRKPWHDRMLHDYRSMVRARRDLFPVPHRLIVRRARG
jgi:hypothetical protein